jgi:hypothetical protein
MNKTFTVLSNKYCSSDNEYEQDQSNRSLEKISQLSITTNQNRFCTFTKNQQRYFDSPTIITLDDDIPISRCLNKTSVTPGEPNLNETDLSDLFVFTNRMFQIISMSIKSFCL